jgi:predicted Zn-dependent peptidase
VRTLPFERSEPVAGVRLVTESMPHVRSVSIGLWVDVGSRDETDDIAGASHFLEHLLFKGTARRSAQDIAEAFDAVGGEINAYSAREHTCVYARVLDADLPMAIDILGDMFHEAALRSDEVESERRVVLEEIHMAGDLPEDRVHDLFASTAWPGHALGRPVLGTEQTVGGMSRDRIEQFYRRGYVPDHLVVAAAGNISHESLTSHMQAAFRNGTKAKRRSAQGAARFGGPRAAYDTRDSEQVHLVWGVESVGRSDPDRYAQSVMSVLYGGGLSSRLFQEIREKRGLAYSIYSSDHMYLECGSFTVYAGMHSSNAAEVLKIVRDEASKVAGGDLSEEEVGRAKGHVRGGLVLSMDDPGGRMSRLGRSELVHGEVLTVDELLAKVDAVSKEDVQRIAERVFGGGGAVLASVGPVAEGSLDFAVEPLS